MRSLTFLAVAFFMASTAFAGCLGDDSGAKDATGIQKKTIKAQLRADWDTAQINASLSQAQFSVHDLIKEDFWHTGHDGVKLHTRIFRPKTPDTWKAPVILHMSPYFGPNNAATGPVPSGSGMDGWLVSHFLPRGYAIALNDVRGTGESGGCLEQTGPLQTQDGYRVVEDLASQPWSNGRVGMIGISYDGETQQSTATAAPPHLTTVVPLASVAGQYEWNFYDGIPYTTNGIAGMVSYMGIGVRPGMTATGLPYYPERWGCHPENLKEGADPRGDLNKYWEDREIRLHVHKIVNTSFLYVHGLEDWNVKPNHIRDWYNDVPTDKHAWIGQWQHNFPDRNTFKNDWSRSDWRYTVHRWFDHWLLGLDTGIMQEPAVQVMDSQGRWRFEDAWPPLGLSTRTYYLSPEGKLLLEPARDGSRQYRDTARPMEEASTDSLLFESETLAEDLHYAGWPVLNLTATLDRSGTHFAVHLFDVAPDGTSKIINRGYLDAQHRKSLRTSEPVPTGQATAYSIRFFPQDDVVPAGHKLRVKIGAMDGWIQPDGTFANVVVSLGGAKATLTLPIVEDSTARFFTPLSLDP